MNIQCNKVNEKLILLFAESSQFIVIQAQKNLGSDVHSSFLLDIYVLWRRNGNSF
jgi:hypothetical protein